MLHQLREDDPDRILQFCDLIVEPKIQGRLTAFLSVMSVRFLTEQ